MQSLTVSIIRFPVNKLLTFRDSRSFLCSVSDSIFWRQLRVFHLLTWSAAEGRSGA